MGTPDFSSFSLPLSLPAFGAHPLFLQFHQFPFREATALSLLIAAFLFLLLFFLFRWSSRRTDGVVEGPETDREESRFHTISESSFPPDGFREGGEIHETVVMEQERWNLPGFQSLDLIAPPVGPEYIGDSFGGGGTMRRTGVRLYRFSELPFTTNVYSDVEAFARELLLRTSDLLQECELTLHLRNGKGAFPPVLGKRGELFVSGEALRSLPFSSATMESLERGVSVLGEEGTAAFFPLFGGERLLGILHAEARENLLNRELLQRVWSEIKMFGDILYQAKIFEQSTRDPESTLYNGIQFHADLLRFFRSRDLFRQPVSLYLIQFGSPDDALFMRLNGLALAPHFPPDQMFYRIARDVVALLGPGISGKRMEETLVEYEAYISLQNPVFLKAGGALLLPETESVEVWFHRAVSALEHAKESEQGGRRSVLYEENLSGYGSSQR